MDYRITKIRTKDGQIPETAVGFEARQKEMIISNISSYR